MVHIDYLQEFAELAKHLSFTETARLLNMGQPTLSKHINQLERELKLSLFDRTGASPRLTKAGAALLPYVYQVLDAQNDFNSVVAELRKAPPPRLTVSGLTDEGPSTEVLGFLISLLSEKYGSSFLEVKSRFNRDPREMLGENEVDLVFDPAPSEESLDREVIEALHIADLRLIAVVSRDNPLFERESVTLEDLAAIPLVKYEGLYLNRSWSHIERVFGDEGLSPRMRSRHFASVAELFATCANLGSAALIVGCNFGARIPTGIRPFCAAKPIADDSAKIPLYFLFRKDNANPVLRDAVQLIKEMPAPPLCFE